MNKKTVMGLDLDTDRERVSKVCGVLAQFAYCPANHWARIFEARVRPSTDLHERADVDYSLNLFERGGATPIECNPRRHLPGVVVCCRPIFA